MTSQSLESALETMQLFEQCYYAGFRNLWQILPKIQTYQSTCGVVKKYRVDVSSKRLARQRKEIDATHRKIHEVYEHLPYERIQGNEAFAPVFAFRDELIPVLDTIVETITTDEEADIVAPLKSLRLQVVEKSDEFFYNLRASVVTLRQHAGYKQYVPHANVVSKKAILDDKYLQLGSA